MWRPGDPAPFKQGKGKSKKRKRGGATKGPARGPAGVSESDRDNQRDHDASRHGHSRSRLSKSAQSGEDKYVAVAGGDILRHPESQPANIDLVRSPGSSRPNISSNILNLKFMARKEEARKLASEEAARRRKENEQKWVISSALVSKGGPKSLVCEPINVAPRNAKAALGGRRSFGAFNPKIEEASKQAKLDEESERESAEINESAISAEEMAEHYLKKRKKCRFR